MTKVQMVLTALIVALCIAALGYGIRHQRDITPKPQYKEFVPDMALGPVVRVNKDGKVELRDATEAEYRETIGNLASTVIQLGAQLDQLKNPKKAEEPKAVPPPVPAPEHGK